MQQLPSGRYRACLRRVCRRRSAYQPAQPSLGLSRGHLLLMPFGLVRAVDSPVLYQRPQPVRNRNPAKHHHPAIPLRRHWPILCRKCAPVLWYSCDDRCRPATIRDDLRSGRKRHQFHGLPALDAWRLRVVLPECLFGPERQVPSPVSWRFLACVRLPQFDRFPVRIRRWRRTIPLLKRFAECPYANFPERLRA